MKIISKALSIAKSALEIILILPILPFLYCIAGYFKISEMYEEYQSRPRAKQIGWKGKLPHSVKLKGTFYRWHSTEFLNMGCDFWKTFEDGPWKWFDQQRFAGRRLNCGHFFSLTEETATWEIAFYNVKPNEDCQLLEIEASFKSILDLTNEKNIAEVFRHCVRDPDRVLEWPRSRLLARLMHTKRSGNSYTDSIGYWASRRGYDGIMFFSARAFHLMKFDIHDYGNPNIFDTDMLAWEEIKDLAYLNVIVFSGSQLTANIRRYAIGHDEWCNNPYYKWEENKLNSLIKYNTEYQNRQRTSIARYCPPDLGVFVWQEESPHKYDPIDDYANIVSRVIGGHGIPDFTVKNLITYVRFLKNKLNFPCWTKPLSRRKAQPLD